MSEMISIKLRNFRGAERAEITCGPLALVGGKNATGKSSLAQATGAVLSGNTLPLAGLTKGSAGMLVHVGADGAAVEIRSEAGTARIAWPSCEATATGEPPHASAYAAGLESVALLAPKERARVLGDYLHADPTREDLTQALADVELGDQEIVEAVWKLIEEKGWDGTHTSRREKGAELKGRWKQVTKANYGSRIAASWKPEDWLELGRHGDLDNTTEERLASALKNLQAVHDKAVATAAISGAERERLQAQADQVEDLKDKLADAEIEETRREDELMKAQNARDALPSTGSEAAMPCPHCGEPVVLRRVNLAEQRLEKAEVVAPAEFKKRRLALAEADGTVERFRGELTQQNRTVEATRHEMHLAIDAANKLATMPPSGGDAAQIAAAKESLEIGQRRLAAFRQKAEAGDLHAKVASNELLIEILAPDGVRGQKLGRVLEVFGTTRLAPLTDAADWKPVTVDPAMTIAYGGRPYALLSTSEQYRVRAVLAVAMAQLDGSAMVVFDAADVLDGTTRSGLVAMLEDAGLPALICLTLSRREQLPDLAAAGLGASYWLDQGVAEPLHQLEEAAA
jgi:hypothetical protein